MLGRPRSVALVRGRVRVPTSVCVFRCVCARQRVPQLHLVTPLPCVVVRHAAVGQETTLQARSSTKYEMTCVRDSRLPTISGRVRLIYAARNARVVKFLPRFVCACLVSVTFRVLHLLISRTSTFYLCQDGNAVVVYEVFYCPPVFIFCQVPFTTVRMFCIRLTRRIVRGFKFVTYFIAIRMGYVRPYEYNGAVAFLGRINVLRVQVRHLRTSRQRFLLPNDFPFLRNYRLGRANSTVRLDLRVIVLVRVGQVTSYLILSKRTKRLRTRFVVIRRVTLRRLLVPQGLRVRVVRTSNVNDPFRRNELYLIGCSKGAHFFYQGDLYGSVSPQYRGLVRPGLRATAVALGTRVVMRAPVRVFERNVKFLVFFTTSGYARMPTPILNVRACVNAIVYVLPPNGSTNSALNLSSHLRRMDRKQLCLLRRARQDYLTFTYGNERQEFKVVARHTKTNSAVRGRHLIRRLSAISVLSPVLVILIYRVGRPPFGSIKPPRGVKLPKDRRGVINGTIFRVRREGIRRLQASLIYFCNGRVHTFLRDDARLLIRIRSAVVAPLLLMSGYSIRVGPNVSIIDSARYRVANFTANERDLSRPWKKHVPRNTRVPNNKAFRFAKQGTNLPPHPTKIVMNHLYPITLQLILHVDGRQLVHTTVPRWVRLLLLRLHLVTTCGQVTVFVAVLGAWEEIYLNGSRLVVTPLYENIINVMRRVMTISVLRSPQSLHRSIVRHFPYIQR